MMAIDNAPQALIARIERIIAEGAPRLNEAKARRALSLAAEAARTLGDRQTELLRDARELLRQAQGKRQ
jgi:hypothetical protein